MIGVTVIYDDDDKEGSCHDLYEDDDFCDDDDDQPSRWREVGGEGGHWPRSSFAQET